MNWFNLLVFWIGSSITIFIQVLSYKKLLKYDNYEFNYKSILLILLFGILITYNANTFDGTFRAFISYSLILILENLLFNDSIKKTLVYGTFCYIVVVVSEIILDIILLSTKLIDLETIDKSTFGKFFLSITMVLPSYIIVGFKFIKKLSNAIEELMEKSIAWFIFVVLFLAATIIIAYNNISSLSLKNYFGNIFLLVLFIILIAVIIFKEYRVNREVKNTEILLNFMSEYENKIEEDRINRHEMLNNLLILKSYSNKNSASFNNTLDEFIDIYSKNKVGIKNIYKLPSGLKGIIYYKISDINNKGVKININISKQLSNYLEKLNNKTYTTLCKIVGITFDNAIEAALKSKEKIINFDVYERDENIIIEITNSYGGKVDINKLNNKYYSTKGKGRGLGLYIVEKLTKSNKNISMKQVVDKKFFITQLYIKKSR